MPSLSHLALQALEGKRVERAFPCVYCLSRDAVLRRHWCVDELELYCDSCERWTGERITVADIATGSHEHSPRGFFPAALLAAPKV